LGIVFYALLVRRLRWDVHAAHSKGIRRCSDALKRGKPAASTGRAKRDWPTHLV